MTASCAVSSVTTTSLPSSEESSTRSELLSSPPSFARGTSTRRSNIPELMTQLKPKLVRQRGATNLAFASTASSSRVRTSFLHDTRQSLFFILNAPIAASTAIRISHARQGAPHTRQDGAFLLKAYAKQVCGRQNCCTVTLAVNIVGNRSR